MTHCQSIAGLVEMGNLEAGEVVLRSVFFWSGAMCSAYAVCKIGHACNLGANRAYMIAASCNNISLLSPSDQHDAPN